MHAREIEVVQARSPKIMPYAGNFYIGKVVCPKCGDKGTLSLKSGGSFQVQHYVMKVRGKDVRRYCTLSSLGKLVHHGRRELKIAIPVWAS